MKAAIIVLDGLADRSQQGLGGRTPLQAAALPGLDALASGGACGHMYPIAPGACPGSDLAHWHILGYSRHGFPGRASVEAAGAGFGMAEGEVAFRVNLAISALDGGERYVQAAPAYLPAEQALQLADCLAGYRAQRFASRLVHLGGPFMVLVLSGGASPLVSDSDPLFYRLAIPEVVPLDGAPEAAAETAAELERFSGWAASQLEGHPVNTRRSAEGMPAINQVLVKWPSVRPEAPAFHDQWGFKAVAVASGVFYRGLAGVMGMEFRGVESKEPGEDLYEKLLEARAALDAGFDFAFVHTKAADEASHTGRPSRKVRVIEELDMALSAVAESLAGDPELLTVITADHASPSSGTDEVIHSGESVPVVMAGSTVRIDAVTSFDEVSCAAGSLGTLRGSDLMPLVLSLTNRARFGSSRTGPCDRPYRPLH